MFLKPSRLDVIVAWTRLVVIEMELSELTLVGWYYEEEWRLIHRMDEKKECNFLICHNKLELSGGILLYLAHCLL